MRWSTCRSVPDFPLGFRFTLVSFSERRRSFVSCASAHHDDGPGWRGLSTRLIIMNGRGRDPRVRRPTLTTRSPSDREGARYIPAAPNSATTWPPPRRVCVVVIGRRTLLTLPAARRSTTWRSRSDPPAFAPTMSSCRGCIGFMCLADRGVGVRPGCSSIIACAIAGRSCRIRPADAPPHAYRASRRGGAWRAAASFAHAASTYSADYGADWAQFGKLSYSRLDAPFGDPSARVRCARAGPPDIPPSASRSGARRCAELARLVAIAGQDTAQAARLGRGDQLRLVVSVSITR